VMFLLSCSLFCFVGRFSFSTNHPVALQITKAQTVYVDNEDGAPTAVQTEGLWTVNAYTEAACPTMSGPGGNAGASRWCDNDDDANPYEATFTLPAGQPVAVWRVSFWSVGPCGAGQADPNPVFVDSAAISGEGTISTAANSGQPTGWQRLQGGNGVQGDEFVLGGGGGVNGQIRWRGGSYTTISGWTCVDGLRFVLVRAYSTTGIPASVRGRQVTD
jgi:hypothetical protein